MKLIFAFIFPLLSVCWWDVGHMLTATIAQIHLKNTNPQVHDHFNNLIQSINNLVDNRSRTLIQSSCWADDIKGYKYNMHLWDSWHFINSPYVTDGVFPLINFTGVAINSVAIIQNAKKVLTTNLYNNTAERALFARYLVHVTGDIHQPLHSVALYNQTYEKGDRGGNSLSIYLRNSTKTNLHSFWDSGANTIQNNSWFMVRPLDSQNISSLEDRAHSLMEQFKQQIGELSQVIDPAVWATQSLLFAQNSTYPYVSKTNHISEEYEVSTYDACKKRITLAGYRMANLVLSIYNSDVGQGQSIEDKWEKMKKQAEKANKNFYLKQQNMINQQ